MMQGGQVQPCRMENESCWILIGTTSLRGVPNRSDWGVWRCGEASWWHSEWWLNCQYVCTNPRNWWGRCCPCEPCYQSWQGMGQQYQWLCGHSEHISVSCRGRCQGKEIRGAYVGLAKDAESKKNKYKNELMKFCGIWIGWTHIGSTELIQHPWSRSCQPF